MYISTDVIPIIERYTKKTRTKSSLDKYFLAENRESADAMTFLQSSSFQSFPLFSLFLEVIPWTPQSICNLEVKAR